MYIRKIHFDVYPYTVYIILKKHVNFSSDFHEVQDHLRILNFAGKLIKFYCMIMFNQFFILFGYGMKYQLTYVLSISCRF